MRAQAFDWFTVNTQMHTDRHTLNFDVFGKVKSGKLEDKKQH